MEQFILYVILAANVFLGGRSMALNDTEVDDDLHDLPWSREIQFLIRDDIETEDLRQFPLYRAMESLIQEIFFAEAINALESGAKGPEVAGTNAIEAEEIESSLNTESDSSRSNDSENSRKRNRKRRQLFNYGRIEYPTYSNKTQKAIKIASTAAIGGACGAVGALGGPLMAAATGTVCAAVASIIP